MKISELAEKTGTALHALRHYEGLGLITASRTRGNDRAFDESVVREVVFIRMGREIGFSLAEIAQWLPAYRGGRLTPARMIEALRDRIARLDDQIEAVRAQRSQLVRHIEWFQARERRAAQRAVAAPRPAWPAGSAASHGKEVAMNTAETSKQLDRLRSAVLAMPMARTLGLSFISLEAGRSEIALPIADAFTFRPGQLQATAVFAAADFAAVSAAATLLAPGWVNATIDATLKLLAPARGQRLIARGRVIHAAGLLTVCAADVHAEDDGRETLCATLLGTARNHDTNAARRAA